MKLTINGQVYDITRFGEPSHTTFGGMVSMCRHRGILPHTVSPLLTEDAKAELWLPLYSFDVVIITDTGAKFDVNTEGRLKMLKRIVETENVLEEL